MSEQKWTDNWTDWLPVALGLVTGGLAWVRRWQKRRKEEHRLRGLELQALNRQLDATRLLLYINNVRLEGELMDQYLLAKRDIDELREQLWLATGHESRKADPAVELLKEWRRTHPRVQDMVKPEDLEEGEK